VGPAPRHDTITMSVTTSLLGGDELEHPWLLAAFVFGLVLFVLGFVADLVARPTLAGFLALFSVVTVIMVAFAYVGLLLVKYMSNV